MRGGDRALISSDTMHLFSFDSPPARMNILSEASLAVAVTVVTAPLVFGTKVTVSPPLGPLPLAYQSLRFGDHS